MKNLKLSWPNAKQNARITGLIVLLFLQNHLFATTLMVSSAADSGPGTLRAQIDTAGIGDTIMFSAALDGDTIFLTSGEIVIDTNLTILGNGALHTIIDGSENSRIFSVQGGTVLIDGVTIQNGTAGGGGGILNEGSLTINRSVIRNNESFLNFLAPNPPVGGGVLSFGKLVITNSTVSGNSSSFDGGGIFSFSDLTIINSTISGNTTDGPGGGSGGLFVGGACKVSSTTITNNKGGGMAFLDTAIFHNSIIAGNDGSDAFGIHIDSSSSYNLVGDTTFFGMPAGNNNILGVDPQLGPLAYNGGPTPTHALLCGSPAFNNGNTDSLTDQRGESRGAFGADDIGAFESQLAAGSQTTVFTDSICPGDSLFVGGGWQTTPGIYTDTAISALGCDSILETTLLIRSGSGCSLDSAETLLYLVSDSGWTLSTEVTAATSNMFPWPGAVGYLPHDSTFILPVEVGQPYPWNHLYTVMGSEVIKAGGGVTYYRYEFELTEHQALNARFRMFVDDNMQIFINRHEIALEKDMGKENWRTANHDILFADDGTVINGYMGGDPFDSYTTANLNGIFQTGLNDIILAIRNRTSKPDVGGFSFRMDLDKAGKGVIVKKEAGAGAADGDAPGFVIFPNPASGKATVSMNSTTDQTATGVVNVFDLSGKLVISRDIETEVELNISTLPAGVYLVKVTTGEKILTQKLIKR